MVVSSAGNLIDSCTPLSMSSKKAATTEYVVKRHGMKPCREVGFKDSRNTTTTKATSVPSMELLDRCLPRLHHCDKRVDDFKRIRNVYLRRTRDRVNCKGQSSVAKPVELPGIGNRRRGGTVNIHNGVHMAMSTTTTSSSNSESCSFNGGNSSSETGSESWLSVNGTNSPRRKILIPTTTNIPPANNPLISVSPRRNPRPPSSPRPAHPRFEFDIDEEPNKRAMRRSRHFELTLQNIEERCDAEDIAEPKCIVPHIAKRSSSASPGKRPKNDDEDNACIARRMSMPIDLHDLRKQIEGIRFINIREMSREYIQELLSEREEEVGDVQRRHKCMSWLQSLQES